MSLATSIKDFADILNDIYVTKGFQGDFPKTIFLQQGALYGVKTIASALIYIFTFQWLRDLAYLPLLAPEMNPSSFFLGNLFQDPSSHLFSLLVPSSLQNYGGGKDQLIAGFLNSFFFSLPVSLPHLISIRRLFSQGIVATAASVLGSIVGHSLFLMGVVYGFRFFIIPWFSFEPLNYIFGIITVAIAVNSMAHQKGVKIIPLEQKNTLLKIAFLNFVLTWCEETTLFHSLKHLTVNANTTYLDIYPTTSASQTFVLHTIYFLSFILGHCVFSALFYYLLLTAGEFFRSWSGFTFPKMARIMNKLMLVSIVAFTLSSFPYYGLDYLFTQIGGFLPEDPAFHNTLFSLNQVKTKYPHFFKELPPVDFNKKTPVHLDLNSFDRGIYLTQSVFPETEKQEKKPPLPDESPALSFEELNYQGEYAWIMRNDSTKELSRKQPGGSKTVLKKQKKKLPYLREKGYKFQSRTEQSKNQKIAGETSKWKEGILPGEASPLFIKIDNFLGRTFFLPRAVELEMQKYQTNTLSSTPENQEDTVDNDKTSKKIVQRTANNQNQKKKSDPIQEELKFEQKINANYSKGFTPPFSIEYDQIRSSLWPIKKVIKKRYFLNPVYRTLLETDIDTFLARQPLDYKIGKNQEFHLYTKRQMLEKYYNWLRYYEPLEKTLQLRYQIPTSKSFVDRVYHQQFKGTLKIARRLFKVTFDSQQNSEHDRVVSYDQLLYKDDNLYDNPFLHEELFHQPSTENSESKNEKEEKTNKTDTNLFSEENFSSEINPEKNYESIDSPFIEESSSSPTYVAWDPYLRKLFITNRFAVKQDL